MKHINKGDIIKLNKKDEIPADLILLKSSNINGEVSIQTCNLDGEMNLKKKNSLHYTQSLSINDYYTITGSLIKKTSIATADLNDFTGIYINDMSTTYNSSSSSYILSEEQLLLKGSVLENTDHIHAVVIEVGNYTKIALNSFQAQHKTSKLENMMNIHMYWLFIIQIIIMFIVTSASIYQYYNNTSNKWYLYWNHINDSSINEGIHEFLAYFILFSMMIPIGLYVSLEFVKVMQAYFISMIFICMILCLIHQL